jgi:acyl carrier protein
MSMLTQTYPTEILEMVRAALVDECGVAAEAVTDQVHLLDDLDIDSLDLLNASHRIEKDCGLKLPFREWLTLEYGPDEVVRSPFIVSEICAYIGRCSNASGVTVAGA